MKVKTASTLSMIGRLEIKKFLSSKKDILCAIKGGCREERDQAVSRLGTNTK